MRGLEQIIERVGQRDPERHYPSDNIKIKDIRKAVTNEVRARNAGEADREGVAKCIMAELNDLIGLERRCELMDLEFKRVTEARYWASVKSLLDRGVARIIVENQKLGHADLLSVIEEDLFAKYKRFGVCVGRDEFRNLVRPMMGR